MWRYPLLRALSLFSYHGHFCLPFLGLRPLHALHIENC